MKRLTEKHYHGVDHYLLCSADCHLDMYCALGYKICNADGGLTRPDDDDYCSYGQGEDQSAGLRNASETDS